MSTPALDLPYGTVTGLFLTIRHDGVDEDLTPDVQPQSGTVTLTPTVPAGRIDGALAEIKPVPLRIFGGQIVDDLDEPGVRVLATDTDMGVGEWAWKATYQLDSGLRLQPYVFHVPAGETVSLTDGLIPVDTVPVQIVQGEPGESAYEIMVRRGDWTGTEDEWIDYYFGARGGGDGASSWADIEGKPSAFPPTEHTHTLTDVTGLDAALAGKQPVGDYASPGQVAAVGTRVDEVEETVGALDGRVETLEQSGGSPGTGAEGIDTGWVNVSSDLINGTNATLHIRRVGPLVYWRFTNFRPGSADAFYTPPAWARASNDTGTTHGVYYPQSIPGEAQVEVLANGNLARPRSAGATAGTWWESGYYVLPPGVPAPPA